MPRACDDSTLSISFSSVESELESFLLPAAWKLRVVVEGKSISIIDTVLSSKMEHISTSGKGGASTTAAISIHHICVGEGNGVDSGNGAEYADDYIVSSSSLLYWGRKTKQMKGEILQCRVVCVKIKCFPEGSREQDIPHATATKVPSQTFDTVKQFVTKNLKGEYYSTKYTGIQSEYIGNLDKIKLS